jgi:uncharacterized protein YxjI
MRYVIQEKFMHLTEDSAITDENGVIVYQVNGAFFSLHDRLSIVDGNGTEVASITRRLLTLTPTYEITRHGQEYAEVRKAFFSLFIDRYTVDTPGLDDLDVTGSLFDHEYTITRAGQTIAAVTKAWLTLTATYGVEIADGEDDVLILATVLALDLAEDRER